VKKYFILINILLFSFVLNTKALTYNEIKSRTVCSNFEVAEATSSKTLNSLGCYNDYNSAKNAMNNNLNENLVILERSNNETRVIDAKLALVYLDFGDTLTYYYSNSSLGGYITYMNHASTYGATDGVFLDFNPSNHAIKVKVNTVTGWIKDGTYRIIPLNFVGTTSYYQVTNDNITHYYGKDIQTNYSSYGRNIDKKPSMLNPGKYYSYDGNYFYTSLNTLIKDYKNNNYNNSVNKDNPYYNYYMYLPHRGRSNYTADDIDAYLKHNKGLIGSIYGKKAYTHYSNMWATGIFFKSSETLYGGNAILMMGLAINESGLGQSSIAIDKNNLFGHAAYDSSAYSSATGYLDPYQSIIGHAKSYINCGYANPKDSRYYGSNLGVKSSGMNVMYASDPYWGEKAANYYYMFDRDSGYLDYNYYQLGITTNDSVNVRSEPNTSSAIPYNLKYVNVPLIILGEVEGTSVNGSTKWYKVVSDANLNSSRTSIQECSYTNYYNYNGYVYVHSSFVKKINTSSNGQYNAIASMNDVELKYTEYSSGASFTPKVGKITKNATVYDTATLSVSKNQTATTDTLVTVFMEASVNNQPYAYLIESDYTKNQKGWISADSLSFVTKDLLKVNVSAREDYFNVFNNPGGSVLGAIYDATYSPIIDSTTYNNELWLKIYYNVNGSTAWINTNVPSTKGSLDFTLSNVENSKPVISANDIEIIVNSMFDPLLYVKASDYEDGDITNKVKVTYNGVDITRIGTYQVTYSVTDSYSQTVSKTINVNVIDFKEGQPLFYYESLKHVSDTKFEVKGFIGVKKMNNTNLDKKICIVKEDDLDKVYCDDLSDYENPPFTMSSLDDDKTYNYSDGWFKSEIDFTDVPDGNYYIVVYAYNLDTGYYATNIFTNVAFLDMPRRIDTSSGGIAFDIDYSLKGSPMIVTIRSNDLLSYDEPTSFDPTYNFFNELKINNNTLSITGTSHSAYVSYSTNDLVSRQIIFENMSNFNRVYYDLSYIDNGPYVVELPVSDHKDKTRAWFKKDIDISGLPKGEYAIYLRTTSSNKAYYGELVDVAYTDFSNINTTKYNFKRVDERRLRVELTVK